MTKRCRVCLLDKPVEEFNRDASKKDGRRGICKPCHRAAASQWVRDNPTKRKAILAAYKRRHLEAERIRQRDHQRKTYAADPERHRGASRKWHHNNPTKVAERRRRWQASPTGRIAKTEGESRRRVAKRTGVLPDKIPAAVVLAIIKAYGGVCIYCGSEYQITIDHFQPLSLGGLHAPGNLVPACLSCNSQKWNRDPFVWMDDRGIDADAVVAKVTGAYPALAAA